MSVEVATRLLSRAGAPPSPLHPLSGGDTGAVYASGAYVVKTGGPRGALAAEARALRILTSHHVPVPVLHLADEDGLVMERVVPGPPDPVALGRAIASMHRHAVPQRGCTAPSWLGPVPWTAGTAPDPRTFLRDLRLVPLVARTRPTLGDTLADAVLRAADRVDLPDEGPRLVHGDLWSGNVVHGAQGPVLIDPSCSYGDRGLDLAMMQLFGGFGPDCMRAYADIFPIPDALHRVLPAYRLVHLLVHVALFGTGYVSGVRQALAELPSRP